MRPRSAKTEPMESPVSAVSPASSNRAPASPAARAERGQVLLQLLDPADRRRVERVGLLDEHEPGGVAGGGQHRVDAESPAGARTGRAGSAGPSQLRHARLGASSCWQPGQRRGLPGHAGADDQDLGRGQDAGREPVRRGGGRARGRRRRGSSLISGDPRWRAWAFQAAASRPAVPAATISSATGRAAANRAARVLSFQRAAAAAGSRPPPSRLLTP